MALGHVRAISIAFAILVSSCAGTAKHPATFDSASTAGGKIELYRSGDGCGVRSEFSDSLNLNLPAPCMFVRKPGVTEPTVYHYEEGVGSVYLVNGGIDAEADPGSCGVAVQAVVVRAGTLVAGGLDDTPDAHCLGAKTDEKLYYGLSHP